MKIDINELNDLFFDCHTHCGIMLSSIFNDKMPICQDIGGILNY